MKFVLTICLLLLISPILSARQILHDLDLDHGEWTLIGVPVHNYKYLPVQTEIGTFLTKDKELMREIQKQWDLDVTFNDNCDYHYSLKFYKGKELMRTLKLNLYCSYITDNGMSYEFDSREFERFRTQAQPVNWSRISYTDLTLLKKAVRVMNTEDDVYWYEDIKPYLYSGYITLGINRLPWNTDVDSLYVALDKQIEQQLGHRDFYLKEYVHIIEGDDLYIRYFVNCEQKIILNQKLEHQIMSWRSHLASSDSVHVVAIGLNQDRYVELLKQYGVIQDD